MKHYRTHAIQTPKVYTFQALVVHCLASSFLPLYAPVSATTDTPLPPLIILQPHSASIPTRTQQYPTHLAPQIPIPFPKSHILPLAAAVSSHWIFVQHPARA
ncbi:hypothetical protein BU24DRAFT_420478 [Aaosphaeria arxii CBS 175.79]|uniref:Uncharacterized protein n=1 Tax=Aaosphaeria arxii CBS 175.79 TaxID=1450172 RepID=A0A6A5XW85_9PLEO|nr:uncharacterized protein BU24DRAFT_420478 [Aaosphaeria arxii CBS 175.79]KAF2017432.1 hypothetical protein BU24DRAFT_420478 [Aaosphaeria arxii CBS 175.79]